ncbi:MAG: T9SS type A sorting domain-containing protein [Sphingobacteriaceae bacterium]|nr:MAG: T9SS type A sorting domain-containing protein [Sphingobacteriaceae bacterium]
MAQSSYSGNGGSGFGGAIGGSTLTITENTTTLTFTISKGAGGFNDALVLYLDVVAGGETTTSAYTDAGDPSRTAISGLSMTGNRALLNFPPDFGADFAIAVAPSNTFAGIYALNNGGAFTFKDDAGLTPLTTNNASYTFSITKSSIGFANTSASFRFFGTYLNSGSSTYRSNEGYGTLNFSSVNADGNPGYNTTTATSFLTYPVQVLPVKLLSFTGSIIDSKGKLNWQVANDAEISKYEIEKSVNGKIFTVLQTVAARHTSASQAYTAEDINLSGTNYYRLKTTDLQGIIDYSKIVQLSVGVRGQGFTIFPNPVLQTLNIKMAKLEKGQYDVNVYSASGQLVLAKAIQYDGAGNTLQIELPANMQKGNYTCLLSGNTGKFTSSFLKQ